MSNLITDTQSEWLKYLNDKLPSYLQTLERPGQPGHFLPCARGATELGRQMALGFSCLALKLYYMLDLWCQQESHRKSAWITFLQSFQVESNAFAFIDPPLMNYLTRQVPWYRRLSKAIFHPRSQLYAQKVVIAETKQAIATLAEVGQKARQPYQGFPMTAGAVNNYLLGLDWTKPWGAGSHASALMVFLKIELPKLVESSQAQELLGISAQFFDNLADARSGAYFKGEIPEHGQIINGAMKVLTALDWLEMPIHYPERLIDTCLERLPPAEGCYLVDAVYVLYRCLQQTDYQKASVQAYCQQLLDMIRQHHQPDGGFSYYLGRSQTTYYTAPITQGLPASDIHGTCLLVWALIMLLDILDSNRLGWKVIKP